MNEEWTKTLDDAVELLTRWRSMEGLSDDGGMLGEQAKRVHDRAVQQKFARLEESLMALDKRIAHLATITAGKEYVDEALEPIKESILAYDQILQGANNLQERVEALEQLPMVKASQINTRPRWVPRAGQDLASPRERIEAAITQALDDAIEGADVIWVENGLIHYLWNVEAIEGL